MDLKLEISDKEPEKGNDNAAEPDSDCQPWWLNLNLIGFEDDEDDDESDDSDDDEDDEEDEDSDDDEDESDDESDEDEDESEDDDDSKSKGKNIKGLQSALRKERMAHKKYKRLYQQERNRKKTVTSKSSDDKDDKKSEETPKGPTDRERRLAERVLNREIDTVIMRFATKAGFTDPEDAVKLVNRRDIVTDQDEEDPTMVDIDEESVEDAVKDLAKRKKHLLNRNNGAGRRSGSKMGGRKKTKDEASDDVLRKRYGLRSM